jgi:hypothetical protein
LGWSILDKELNLEDVVTTLGSGSLEGSGLLWFLVVWLDPLLNVCWFNLGNVELSSEGVSVLELLIAVNVVEEVSQWMKRETSVFLVDFSQHGGAQWDVLLKSGLFGWSIISNLTLNLLGKLWGANESHNVRVVTEEEDFLLGWSLIIGGWSDSDYLSSSEMRELELKSEGVKDLTRLILEL